MSRAFLFKFPEIDRKTDNILKITEFYWFHLKITPGANVKSVVPETILGVNTNSEQILGKRKKDNYEKDVF